MRFVHLTATTRGGFRGVAEVESAAWLFARLRASFPWALACALMLDHLHLCPAAAGETGRAEPPETRLRRILAHHGRRFGTRWDVHVEVASTAKITRRMVRYVLLNPVRGGLVRDPWCWPWTTLRDLGRATVHRVDADARGVGVEPSSRAGAMEPGRATARRGGAGGRVVGVEPSSRAGGMKARLGAGRGFATTEPQPWTLAPLRRLFRREDARILEELTTVDGRSFAPPREPGLGPVVADLGSVEAAVAAASRVPLEQLSRRGASRDLVLATLISLDALSQRDIARMCSVGRHVVPHARDRVPPHAVAAARRCLADPRLR